MEPVDQPNQVSIVSSLRLAKEELSEASSVEILRKVDQELLFNVKDYLFEAAHDILGEDPIFWMVFMSIDSSCFDEQIATRKKLKFLGAYDSQASRVSSLYRECCETSGRRAKELHADRV